MAQRTRRGNLRFAVQSRQSGGARVPKGPKRDVPLAPGAEGSYLLGYGSAESVEDFEQSVMALRERASSGPRSEGA